jgi:hypothetical protein
MQTTTRKISTLIETQLPGFISSEYENFSKFVEKYYEHLETRGNTLDIISNITKYRDIDFYEKNILNQFTILSSDVSDSVTTITVDDASSFPEKDGYLRINDEICFYRERTDTQFLDVSRGVSGNTTLGDLYNESTFVTTQAASHYSGAEVYNISNLFLYAFIKSFETQYLAGIPEKYLKGDIDKRTLIKNIGEFYKSKGTEKSIKFIFNSIISKTPDDVPEVYNPKDYTLKASVSDWTSTYSLKVKILSGNPEDLIGQRIIQSLDPTKPDVLYASASVDNVIFSGRIDDNDIYEIVLDPASINGTFDIASKTILKTPLLGSATSGDRIDVDSTLGWRSVGRILINNEEITFKSKNVNQFIIDRRSSNTAHSVGSDVYSFSTVEGAGVKLLTLGVLYNLSSSNPAPYAQEGDLIQISNPGFETKDPVIYDKINDRIRWFINTTNTRPVVPSNSTIQSAIEDLNADVSAIYEDDQYYYICSSTFPSTQILTSTLTTIPEDVKNLRLIRKQPITTTEIYETNTRDVGIFVDGTVAFSYKDEDYIDYGKIVGHKVISKGNGYRNAPFVLINDQPGKARAVMSGETLQGIVVDTDEVFDTTPTVTVTAGRNAVVTPIVTSGRVTSIRIDNPGEYYSAPPIVRITDLLGKGKFAEFESEISLDGEITGFRKLSEGRFYTQENIRIELIEDARGREASVEVSLRRWYKNRYNTLSSSLDENGGYIFPSFASRNLIDKDYGYGIISNPRRLRYRLGDNITSTFIETTSITHSPIIGYAYDGNPIYGPYGYQDPLDNNSSVARLSSGYALRSSRLNGPLVSEYPLGTFIDDYEWIPSVNSGRTILDKNNGRYCVTPEYPNGVYAYFLTIDGTNIPQFPYIIGERFYSLPIDSNYNSEISQDDLPKNVRRLSFPGLNEKNGDGSLVKIEEVQGGFVSGVIVESSRNNAFVGAKIYSDSNRTNGKDFQSIVSSVKGKQVTAIDALQNKVLELETIETAYLFAGDTITQSSTGATGEIVGNVFNSNRVVLKDVNGTFNTTNNISSNTSVINLALNENASYTRGAIVSLEDGINAPIATGEVLERTISQNSLKLRVLSGTFNTNNTYFLRSDDLNDSTGITISSITSLSQGLRVSTIKENVALVETSSSHGLTINDDVVLDILPNASQTETTYYVRKRYYQKVVLKEQTISSRISDSGVGRFDILNSGFDYQTGIVSDVELIFQDQSLTRTNIGAVGDINNARARITVSDIGGTGYGTVTNVEITDKGSGYKKGDILTIADASLNRLVSSVSPQRLILFVDHAGLSSTNTEINLDSVTGISAEDLLRIGNELVLVSSVNTAEKTIQVVRGYNSTPRGNYFDKKPVTLERTLYHFNVNSQFLGNTANSPYVSSYNPENQELLLYFEYGVTSPNDLSLSNTFYDNSVPRKLIKVSSIESSEFKFEISNDNVNFDVNPVIDVQKYYQYKFDTSHSSMIGTFLEFSPSFRKNIISIEANRNSIAPGSSGSFITFRPGIKDGQKVDTQYLRYFYFDKNEIVKTDDAYLGLIEDPLQGPHRVTYSTDRSFVFEYSRNPQYDGSGSMSYTTTSRSAVGEINSVSIFNPGSGYKKTPIITGVEVQRNLEATVTANYDPVGQNVFSVTVVNAGSGYSKPKVIVADGDGTGLEFQTFSTGGFIDKVIVTNSGKNYTSVPTLKVIETDVKLFCTSETIGVPQRLSIIQNGGSYHQDKTLLSSYRSHYSILVKDASTDSFSPGERVVQVSNSNQVFVGYVSKDGWRPGSNILRIEKVTGVIDKNLPIINSVRGSSANIISIFYTNYDADLRTFYDNIGYYSSDRGKIGASSQKLTDSYFYQDYSYVIKSKSPIDVWRDLIKQTVHPAGFNVFGEVVINSTGISNMPTSQPSLQYITNINLAPQNITVVDTRQQITETIVKFNDLNVSRGLGSVYVDTFNSEETLVYELELSADFDGRLDPSTGQRIGTTVFNLREKQSGLAYSPSNQNQLIITLDGIIQEPGEAFTVSGSQIRFLEAPFAEQKFYCRTIKFKDAALNSRYFKKIRSLEFDGNSVEYDLFYEDGSIVKTELNENLFVALNGVLQDAKSNISDGVYSPFGNAYHILRSSDPLVADKIVFSEPPINHEDYYRENRIPEGLRGAETSFLLTVGSYRRLTIDIELSPYVNSFILKDENTQKVVNVDTAKYALVFVDGVLQVENVSYKINGPLITFDKPLNYFFNESGEKTYQKVTIILLYGRSIPNVLTFHDFERDTYFNEITLSVNSPGSYDLVRSFIGEAEHRQIYVYQDDGVLGTIKALRKTGTNTIDLLLIGNNPVYNSSQSLKFTSDGTLRTFELEISTGTASMQFKTDDEGNQILSRTAARRFFGTTRGDDHWYAISKGFANLLPGDKIQIDGENAYREIKSVPYEAKSKEFRDREPASQSFYAKVDASDYNDIVRGEGLSVTARIQNGSVSGLSWNRRDLNLYFANNILLQPTAYQYFTTPYLHFIPRDGNGGGAKAQVIVYGGQVIDVVLTDPGSGYTTAPLVVVARGYNRIKVNRSTVSVVSIGIQSVKEGGFTLFSPGAEVRFEGSGNLAGVSSIATFGNTFVDASATRQITTHVEPATIDYLIPTEQVVDVVSVTYIEARANINTIASVTSSVNTTIDPRIEQVVTERSFAERPTSIEIVAYITQVINDPQDLTPVQSINENGAFLDANFDIGDTIAYVADTSRFAAFGKLIVGGEVISYYNKGFNRFENITRALAGTEEVNHPAGTYLRTLPEFVSYAGLGPELNVQSEVSISTIQSTSVSVTSIVATTESTITQASVVDASVEVKQVYNFETSVGQTTIYRQIVSLQRPGLVLASGFSAYVNIIGSETSVHAKITLETEVLTADIDTYELHRIIRKDLEFGTPDISLISVAAFSNIETEISFNSISYNDTKLASIITSVQDVSTSDVDREIHRIIRKDLEFGTPDISLLSVAAYMNVETQVSFNSISYNETSVSSIVTSVQDVSHTNILFTLDRFYKTGIIDGYQETVIFSNPILLRIGEFYLAEPYNEVTLRDGSIFVARNQSSGTSNLFDSYTQGNIGNTLGMYDTNAFISGGSLDVSTMSIADVTLIYPLLTLGDFTTRKNSAITKSGDTWNLGLPTTNEVGATLQSPISDTDVELSIVSTAIFPTTGTILLGLEQITYTGKTATTLTGLTRGANGTTAASHLAGDYLRTFG